jgi:aryl-alcohol dehydrogenase-like predicted oxidoreductase
MKTDYIDLLYLHMWDATTPITEVLRTANDLVSAGKVLYFAISDTPAWIISHAIAVAERYGWPTPVAVQLPYNVASRGAERAEIPMAHAFGLSVTPWGLLDGGVLTGKYNDESGETRRYDSASERERALAAAVGTIAADIDRSPAQVAINWVRQQGRHIIPILGARTVAQIEDNLGVLDFSLTAEQLARLDAVADFNVDFPLSFLTSDNVRNLVFGDTWERLEQRGMNKE